jgi:hypothetical protein
MITIDSLSDFIASGDAPPELVGEQPIPALIVRNDRLPGLFWFLRVCEYYGVRDKRWDYPGAAPWIKDRSGEMSYSEHPPCDGDDIKGRTSALAKVDGDQLSIDVTLQNDSSELWIDAWGWICLIHRWAGAFQANCELPTGDADKLWTAAGSLPAPKERWLKWCPVKSQIDIAQRIGRHQSHMFQPHIIAKHGAVRVWRMRLGQPVQEFVEMSSPDAMMLGWSHWPCTDMGLSFGSLEPGQRSSVQCNMSFYEDTYDPI